MRVPLSSLSEKCVGIGQQVGLVEHVDHALALGTCIVTSHSPLRTPHFSLHDFRLLLPVGLPRVDHMQQQKIGEHTSELQSLRHLVCRLLLEKKKTINQAL